MLPLRKPLKPSKTGKASKASKPERRDSLLANTQAPDIPARFQARIDRFDIVGIISAILLVVLFWALFKGLL